MEEGGEDLEATCDKGGMGAMINNLLELQELVASGFTDWHQYGDVYAVYNDGAILFNYTQKAQIEGRWNWFERASRGLILDSKSGRVLARPFDKFFNWGERGMQSDANIVSVTEKLDGSLGILYRHNGENRIATRGSFDGEQATAGTQMLWNANHRLTEFPDEWTLLFEIIYPGNRIVVDYGDRSELVLLAARHHWRGDYTSFSTLSTRARYYGFGLPRAYQFNTVADIIVAAEQLDASAEGWVVEFSDGQRFKFKGDRYKEVHRLLCNTSFKRIVEAIASGTLDDAIKSIPDEFLGQVKDWRAEIELKAETIIQCTRRAFSDAPTGSRKEFALWVNEHHSDIAAYLFLMLDGRDIVPTIYKREF